MAQSQDQYPPVSADMQMRVRQIRDYCHVGASLFWQRQIIFAAALGLQAYYYNFWLSVVILAMITLSEIYDYVLFKQVLIWRGRSEAVMRKFMIRIYIGTVFSAGVIAFYAISIAIQQGATTHFMSLFFLFAASLFAAMNNHQLLSVLALRLAIYGGTFLFIPLYDIIRTSPTIDSELWMQFFTVLFVVYFIIDCSRIYLNFYRSNVRQLMALTAEHEKTKIAYIAKTEFISTISHELRTPLTCIKAPLDMACAGTLGQLPENAKKALLLAQRNVNRLSSLVEELLDIQKLEAGKVTMKLEALDLDEIIFSAVDMNQSYTASVGVSIEVEHVDSHVQITADRQRLQQVMSNILSNATKFSPGKGKIVISTELHEDFARIFVSDEGIGLAESDRQKVFEEFSQVDSSDQRSVGGSGLGMNISKRIMGALGGDIDYRKNDGLGTTFHIDIPLVKSDREAEHPEHLKMKQVDQFCYLGEVLSR